MSVEKKYPIAEMFVSPQGEGAYSGTLMQFIRFAGCSVGKPISAGLKHELGLPIYAERCCTYDGRQFDCDTDFRTKEVLTVSEIVARIPSDVGHICFTGGEPLIHDLVPLADALGKLDREEVMVHLETSGTIEIPDDLLDHERVTFFITVSPKLGVLESMIDFADEIKLLVDDKFDESKLPSNLDECLAEIFIQPINNEHSVNLENAQRCVELQKKHPKWRISIQLHKILKVR